MSEGEEASATGTTQAHGLMPPHGHLGTPHVMDPYVLAAVAQQLPLAWASQKPEQGSLPSLPVLRVLWHIVLQPTGQV